MRYISTTNKVGWQATKNSHQLCVCQRCRMAEDTVTSSSSRETTFLGSTDNTSTKVRAVLCSSSRECDNFASDTSAASVGIDSKTTVNTKLAARRPAPLKLETPTHSPPHPSATLVTTPQPSTEHFTPTRPVHICFSDISYYVKTGIKRGTFSYCSNVYDYKR